jgi:dTDP-4-dehydrorhamnose 3,5-epimerase
MSFIFKKLSIPDIILVEPKVFSDERGFFMESFRNSIFKKNGINTNFIQDSLSHSKKGILRGLHFQKNPKAQAKIVTVVRGEIFDVAVDIRKNSPTYGKWISEILSGHNHKSLYIPEGFAHGFCVLSDNVDILYKVNEEYSPEEERGIIWNDSQINITWPIEKPIIQERDAKLTNLENIDNNFDYLH